MRISLLWGPYYKCDYTFVPPASLATTRLTSAALSRSGKAKSLAAGRRIITKSEHILIHTCSTEHASAWGVSRRECAFVICQQLQRLSSHRIDPLSHRYEAVDKHCRCRSGRRRSCGESSSCMMPLPHRVSVLSNRCRNGWNRRRFLASHPPDGSARRPELIIIRKSQTRARNSVTCKRIFQKTPPYVRQDTNVMPACRAFFSSFLVSSPTILHM